MERKLICGHVILTVIPLRTGNRSTEASGKDSNIWTRTTADRPFCRLLIHNFPPVIDTEHTPNMSLRQNWPAEVASRAEVPSRASVFGAGGSKSLVDVIGQFGHEYSCKQLEAERNATSTSSNGSSNVFCIQQRSPEPFRPEGNTAGPLTAVLMIRPPEPH